MKNRVEVLSVFVHLTETQSLTSPGGEVAMIRFTGGARGPLFQGVIQGDGTDTQLRLGQQEKTLSARYLMEGKDYGGNPCRLFIENNGIAGDGPLQTVPRMLTDSPLLRDLETARLTGEIELLPEGDLWIHLFDQGVWREEEFPIRHHGRTVYGILRRPEGAGPFPLVILSHGYGGSHQDSAPLAALLARQGVASYCFDFCGGSPRSRSDLATWQLTLETQTEDLCAIVDRLGEEAGLDSGRLFLFGASQGGFISALAADRRQDRIRGMFLLYPAFCIPADWRARYPAGSPVPDRLDFWDVTLGGDFIRSAQGCDTAKRTGGYPGPVRICHGTEDQIVPLSYVREAQARYRNAALTIYPGEGHGFTPQGTAQLYGEVLAFLQEENALKEI